MIYTPNWNLHKPEVTEADLAEEVAYNMDAIDEALLTPTQKTDLTDGGTTTLHRHATASPSTSLALNSTNAEGASASYSRADHSHGFSVAAAGDIAASTVGGAASAGVSNKLARADHRHALPAFGTTTGTFCQGDDSRLLTTTQKTNLTSGSFTSLHKHYVDAGDVNAGTLNEQRLPVGLGVSSVAQLRNDLVSFVEGDSISSTGSGWREVSSLRSGFGNISQQMTIFYGGSIRATSTTGDYAVAVALKDTLNSGYIANAIVSGSVASGDSVSLSSMYHWIDNININNAVLTLYVYTASSGTVTLLEHDSYNTSFVRNAIWAHAWATS